MCVRIASARTQLDAYVVCVCVYVCVCVCMCVCGGGGGRGCFTCSWIGLAAIMADPPMIIMVLNIVEPQHACKPSRKFSDGER